MIDTSPTPPSDWLLSVRWREIDARGSGDRTKICRPFCTPAGGLLERLDRHNACAHVLALKLRLNTEQEVGTLHELVAELVQPFLKEDGLVLSD